MSQQAAELPAVPETTAFLQRPSGSPSVHLDALRGCAAFFVLLMHWRSAFFLDYAQIPHNNPFLTAAYVVAGAGSTWVITFFVMSGYLVGGSVVRSVGNGSWSWRGYLLTRLTRLYIVLAPALLLGGALDWAGMHLLGADALYGGRAGVNSIHIDAHASLSFPVLLGNLAFLQTIPLPGMGGFQIPPFGSNGVLWSLCNEFWYYIVFPFLVLGLRKRQHWLVRAGCGAAAAALLWFVGFRIAVLFIPWLMGVLIPYLPPVPARLPWTRRLAVAGALALFVAVSVFEKAFTSLGADLVVGAVVTLLVWVVLHCATGPLPSFYVRLAQRAGHSSYSLYLVHVPMLVLVAALLRLSRTYPPSISLLWIGPAVLVLLVVYAQLMYELFEKNTGRVRNWIKPCVMGSKQA